MLKSTAAIIFLGLSAVTMANAKTIVAHRGASAYLPEHTLEAKALAYAMGVDYLEQDLAMTKDDHLVVVHDHFLDRVSDVAAKFPDRARKDGRYYVIDFTLAEIKSLNFTEGFEIKDGKMVAGYKGRFPLMQSTFKIHTLEEEIEFIQGLNKTMGKNVGIYVETKAPWFHKQEGKDISAEELKYIHQNKTGAFLKLCVRMGAILAEAPEEQVQKLTNYAEKIGLAFQIKDDILSEEGDEKILGKPVGNDKKLGKCTYVSQYGLEKAKEILCQTTKEAIKELDGYGEKAEFLKELALYIQNRNK